MKYKYPILLALSLDDYMPKKGSIHSSNHMKQLPDVPVSETLGHVKSLLTVC